MKVSVSRSIHCAHHLQGRIHGHTYKVTVTHARHELLEGVVLPVETLAKYLSYVLTKVNHGELETVIGEPATAERLALWVKDQMPIPVSVRVDIGDEGWVETE